MSYNVNLEFSKPQNDLFFPEEHFPKFTIVRKGRRGGLTKGAANAMIEYGLCEGYNFLPDGELLLLWGDTISANIDKYVERYFMPILKKLPQKAWKWKAQERVMKIGRATIDFRSADRPENWEGFGYHLIFLNEAGIILEDNYLYENAVLPMLVDFENAKIIVAGAPKGKRTKLGKHKFYELYEKSLDDNVRYRNLHFTGYDNPFIAREEIKLIEEQMDVETAKQEIYGEFIDLNEKRFLYAYNETKHVTNQPFEPNPHLNIIISFDFNKDPMTCSIGQSTSIRSLKIFDHMKMDNGSTPELCDRIIAKYPQFIGKMDVTGDSTGRNRSPLLEGDVNHYVIIRRKLKLKDHNLKVQTKNKELSASRILCNSILQNADITIMNTCKDLVNDVSLAAVDGFGELIKTQKQGLHFFDNFRYMLEAVFPDFLDRPHIYTKKV